MFVIGALINATGGAMFIPFLFDFFMGSEDWWVFLMSAGIAGFAGTLLMIASTERVPSLNQAGAGHDRHDLGIDRRCWHCSLSVGSA